MDDAIPLVREQCVFTTHTPVAAGNDEFDAALMTKAFGSEYFKQLGLAEDEFLALGRVDQNNKTERYGLTPLAIRMCRSTNGVSLKHGEVSRALWQKLWPEKKLEEIPISYITNGVHVRAAGVFDGPEEDWREEQHEEAQRRPDEKAAIHALSHAARPALLVSHRPQLGVRAPAGRSQPVRWPCGM